MSRKYGKKKLAMKALVGEPFDIKLDDEWSIRKVRLGMNIRQNVYTLVHKHHWYQTTMTGICLECKITAPEEHIFIMEMMNLNV
jgi:hypothetical protein